ALSFALSVVDMALILGPTTPPTLAVAMTRWFLSADTGLILPASAAAMALAAFAACSVALWIGAERLVACVGRARLRRGNRGLPASPALRLAAWTRPGAGWGNALEQTLILAVATTALSLALAIAWLEGEDRAGMRRARWAEALIYLPLLVPQAAFLFGLSVVLLRLGLSGGLTAVIWGQMLFVFPYVMLALSDPWRALD